MADGKTANVADVRDLLDPLGFTDAKVSDPRRGSGGDSVRVQAEVVDDPIRTIQQTLADYGEARGADVPVRPQRATAAARSRSRRPPTRR